MSTKTALVVGGTGPTGPDIVNGLVERGYRTTIFHSGQHEVPLPEEVTHIHGDVHFRDTISAALGSKAYDVALIQYGRLKDLAHHLGGRVGHLVAIGGMNAPLAPADDPTWGSMGKPALLREEDRLLITQANETTKFGFKVAEAYREFFKAAESEGSSATYIAYPTLYGPRQPGAPEWAIVRRIRDGRRKIILPDGGLRIEARGYVHNVSQAPLLALDDPDVANGKTYVVCDRDQYTVKARVESIAQVMGKKIEVVSLPFEVATPAHPLYRVGPDHRVGWADKIREELGYTERFDAATALADTVTWLLAQTGATIQEIERQLSDNFDYEFEDALIAWWNAVLAEVPTPASGYAHSHVYRHPKSIEEEREPRQ